MDKTREIRSEYTYLKERIEEAGVLKKLLEDKSTLLWRGIKVGRYDLELLNSIENKSKELIICTEKIRRHTENILSLSCGILPEKQMRIDG